MSNKLSPAVQAEIERRRFLFHDPRGDFVGWWMRDMEAIAILAAQEAARECVEICDGLLRLYVKDKQSDVGNAIAQHFGIER